MISCFIQHSQPELVELNEKQQNRLTTMRIRCKCMKVMCIVLCILTSCFTSLLWGWTHWWITVPVFLISQWCIWYSYQKLWPDALLKEQVDILMGGI